MLGETYKNKDGKDVFTIKKGTLPDGNDQIPFSTVKFRSTDKYDEELTKLLDNYASAEKILNYIIKYSWGEMRSSNNIQTVIAREPNEEEKEAFRAGYGNGWPEDTVAWRCFHSDAIGSYDDGCQSLLDYEFDNFNYVNTFDLRAHPSINYYAYTFKRPIISHRVLGGDGLYDSVSKPLLTTNEYHDLVERLRTINTDDKGVSVFRFLLKEDANPDDEYADNTEIKIVDVLSGDIEGGLMIFDSIEEADGFYKEAANYRMKDTGYNWNGSYFTNMVPRASFTNTIKSSDEPNTPDTIDSSDRVNQGGNSLSNMKMQNNKSKPKTSDNNMPFMYFGLFILSTLIAKLKRENSMK